MQALMIVGDADQAFEMMDMKSFDDNGGEPDGNALLSVDFENDDATRLVDVGLAVLTDPAKTRVASVEAMAKMCGFGIVEFEDDAERADFVRETLIPSIESHVQYWTYFSADDRFIIVNK